MATGSSSLYTAPTLMYSDTGISSASKRLKLDSNAKLRAVKKYRKNSLLLSKLPYKQKQAMRAIAKQVLNQNTEQKYNDVLSVVTPTIDVDGLTIDTTSGIAQGDNNKSNRIGEEISLNRLGVRVTMISNPNSAYSFVHWRVIVARWHNENGDAPGPSSMLENWAAVPEIRPILPYKFDQNKNWTVIDDCTYFTGPYATANASAGWQSVQQHDKVYPLNHKTQYQADNAVQDGGVYVFVFNNIPTSGTNKPGIHYYTRLYYKDD